MMMNMIMMIRATHHLSTKHAANIAVTWVRIMSFEHRRCFVRLRHRGILAKHAAQVALQLLRNASSDCEGEEYRHQECPQDRRHTQNNPHH